MSLPSKHEQNEHERFAEQLCARIADAVQRGRPDVRFALELADLDAACADNAALAASVRRAVLSTTPGQQSPLLHSVCSAPLAPDWLVRSLLTLSERGGSTSAGDGGDRCSHPDALRWRPLHTATAHGSAMTVRILLEHGASLDARTDSYLTAPDLLGIARYAPQQMAKEQLFRIFPLTLGAQRDDEMPTKAEFKALPKRFFMLIS